MKVLWITNILFPEAEEILTGNGVHKSSGGWMIGAAEALLTNIEVELYVATVSRLVTELKTLNGKSITYYVIPYGKGNEKINKAYIPYWKLINDNIKPDIVHIHGTEYSHGYSYILACGNDNVVVSIQGLVSACAQYYYCGMSLRDIIYNISLRDIVKRTHLLVHKAYQNRAKCEIMLLRSVNHVIGRTSWDKARTWSINSKAKYHFCNEILRTEFYTGNEWSIQNCDLHSIFFSQAGYPIKGLHQVLKAIKIVREHYPDAKLRIAGNDIVNVKFWQLSSYAKYIRSLIKSLSLEDCVTFTGRLSAIQMKEEYLKCNVFVSASSIENSSNSLGEAQILGVPCVASYVGGIPDMMSESQEYLYRYEEVESLAYIICKVFDDYNVTIKEAMRRAQYRHDSIKNTQNLLGIYHDILSDSHE